VTVEARILAELERRIAAVKTYDQYRARLWGAVLRLYNGGRDAAFEASFVRSIDHQLSEAWDKGAEDCGVMPDEMTADDFTRRNAIINNETEFISGLAEAIQADKDGGMERPQFESKYQARVDIWANRYNETVNRAHMQFGSKLRQIWRTGPTEKKCKTCSALNGIVAFGHEWESAGFHPQMPPNELLDNCRGWNCLCTLTPTTQRRSNRAMDRLTQIATRV
jgi:hypothetical protein